MNNNRIKNKPLLIILQILYLIEVRSFTTLSTSKYLIILLMRNNLPPIDKNRLVKIVIYDL